MDLRALVAVIRDNYIKNGLPVALVASAAAAIYLNSPGSHNGKTEGALESQAQAFVNDITRAEQEQAKVRAIDGEKHQLEGVAEIHFSDTNPEQLMRERIHALDAMLEMASVARTSEGALRYGMMNPTGQCDLSDDEKAMLAEQNKMQSARLNFLAKRFSDVDQKLAQSGQIPDPVTRLNKYYEVRNSVYNSQTVVDQNESRQIILERIKDLSIRIAAIGDSNSNETAAAKKELNEALDLHDRVFYGDNNTKSAGYSQVKICEQQQRAQRTAASLPAQPQPAAAKPPSSSHIQKVDGIKQDAVN